MLSRVSDISTDPGAELIQMATTLFVIPGCLHCDRLRARLTAEGKTFREIDVTEKPETVPELLKLTGRRRVVPVLIDGTSILVAPDGGTEF